VKSYAVLVLMITNDTSARLDACRVKLVNVVLIASSIELMLFVQHACSRRCLSDDD
jgi:hypothetical protein